MPGLFSKYHYSIAALVVVIIFLFTISCKECEEHKAVDFLKTHIVDKGSTEKKVVSNSGSEIYFFRLIIFKHCTRQKIRLRS